VKSKTKKILVAATAAPLVLAVSLVGYQQVLSSKYEAALAELNAQPGITATSGGFSFGIFNSSSTTNVTIDNEQLGMFSKSITNGDKLALEIEHEVNLLSYPVEVTHSVFLGPNASANVSEYLELDEEASKRFMLPLQLVSQHNTETQTLLGMTDHIHFGRNIDFSPIRFTAVAFDDGKDAAFFATSKAITASSQNSPAMISIEDAAFSWNGSFKECETICTGTHNFETSKLSQFGSNGVLELVAENLSVKMGTSLMNGAYRFTFDTVAASLESATIDWDQFVLHSSTEDVQQAAIKQFTADVEKLVTDDSISFLAQNHLPAMYARFLQSGMTLKVDKLNALAESGEVHGSLRINLPSGSMPDMVHNPLGLIKVLNGELNLTVPVNEFDKLLGVHSARSILATGFATLSNDKSELKTDISVANGSAVINGRQVSL
jgi:hypothetical protein